MKNKHEVRFGPKAFYRLSRNERERLVLESIIQQAEGDLVKVANSLGLSMTELYKKLDKVVESEVA